MAYDLTQINCSSIDHAYSEKSINNIPDVVIVKKVYPMIRAAQQIRYWKLLHFNGHTPEEQINYTEFLQDMEEDPVLRSNVTLHKLDADDPKMQKLEERIVEISPTFEVK